MRRLEHGGPLHQPLPMRALTRDTHSLSRPRARMKEICITKREWGRGGMFSIPLYYCVVSQLLSSHLLSFSSYIVLVSSSMHQSLPSNANKLQSTSPIGHTSSRPQSQIPTLLLVFEMSKLAQLALHANAMRTTSDRKKCRREQHTFRYHQTSK